MNITIAQRRHNNLSKSDPKDVVPLGHDHRALTEMRTLFQSTVLDVKEGRRILISGHNNRKIGKQVAKGIWKGMPIFTLTLEERATCPSTCFMLKSCYGNAMPFARRNRHGEEFIAALHDEISGYAVQYPEGFVVRLHVLGDFYSVDYVTCWDFWLTEFPQLHVYGYTSRTQDSDIGRAIIGLNNEFPDRSYIRWSGLTSLPMGATVIARVPESSMVPEGLVCPAETSDAECCATCTLCWSPAMRNKTIVFIQHGKGATMTKANITLVSQKSEDGLRQIRSFNTGLQQWDALAGEIIEIKQVDPTELWVDDRYQRNLSRKGTQLITKICKSWDWRKFKPPVVTTEADGRLHVIDGQHTAIAAASHPQIKKIPVMLVDATTLAERAKTFIGINRDRVAVTPAQIFYAEFAGNDPEAHPPKSAAAQPRRSPS